MPGETAPTGLQKSAKGDSNGYPAAMLPLQGYAATIMGKLIIFIPDGEQAPETEKIGEGSCLYRPYKVPHGFWRKKREKRLLSRLGNGCFGIQKELCDKAKIPCLSGDAATLVHTCFLSALPPGIERITLFPGKGYKIESLKKLSGRVRFLEMIEGEGNVELAEALQAETGQCIPLCRAPSEGFMPLRLPGAVGGSGMDLSRPETGCSFLPPPPLRRVWTYTDKSGDALAALLAFFGLKADDTHIFLSKVTKEGRIL